jgi:carbon-monoxide dehydrogenase medium subunit
MWHSYHQVSELQQAIELLDKYQGNSKIIAGATDLWLEFERGMHKDVHVLVDISRIKGLDQITVDDQGYINLGPLVTHSHVVRSELIKDYAFALLQACVSVGSPQIRNRGTIVGNVATASPANDTIAPLMALNAIVVLSSKNGSREIPLTEFYTGVRKHKIAPSELITNIKFKKLEKSTYRSFFIKHGLRKAQSISLINIAVVYKISEDDSLSDMRIAIGAAAPTIIRAEIAEKYVEGKSVQSLDIEHLCKLASESTSPIDDLRSPAIYRTDMVTALLQKAIKENIVGKKQLIPPEIVTLWGKSNSTFIPLQVEMSSSGTNEIEFILNGKKIISRNYRGKSLLDIIRDDGQLKGSKEGCGEGECGACTVYLEGIAVLACLIPAERAHKSTIQTVESLSDANAISKLQEAFIDQGAVQCGYCTPGFIMSGTKLLEEVENPTKGQIHIAISGNLCRCTGYYKIVSAIEKAAE